MSSTDELGIEVKEKARKWGADLIGFASVDRFDRYPPEHHPQSMLEDARTVIVIGIHMVDPSLDLWLHPEVWQEQGLPARAFEDEILRAIAYRIALHLERSGSRANVISYNPSLFLKEAGYFAGLGVFGKNNLLLTPAFGPNIRLRALVTDAQFDSDSLIDQDLCAKCSLCIQACPANALAGKYDKQKCRAYCESHLEHITEDAVLWCIKCIEACPHTRTSDSG